MSRAAVIVAALLVPAAGWAAPAGLDLSQVWDQGDAVAHVTLLILAVMSVTTWYVAAVGAIEQSRMLSLARQAEAALARPGSAEEMIAALPRRGPFRLLAETAVESMRRHDAGLVRAADLPAWLALTLGRAVIRALGRIGGGLSTLATIASTAPFVGLFGTVWSIHRALSEIGLTGQASIERVAGPVGESLVMTALGLAVAVPAVLVHNALVRRHKRVTDTVRGFAGDLQTWLLGGGGGRPRLAEAGAGDPRAARAAAAPA